MIIRSCAAGNIDAILLPTKGAAQISPLVIKASAGALFKMPITKTGDLKSTLKYFKEEGVSLYTLSSHAEKSYKEQTCSDKTIFVLGNESEGSARLLKNSAMTPLPFPCSAVLNLSMWQSLLRCWLSCRNREI